MDWARAKTILIVAFLLLDVFLGWQLWVNEENEIDLIDQNVGAVTDLDKMLENYNIQLAVDLPEDTPEISYLRVRFGGFRIGEQIGENGQIVELREGQVEARYMEPQPFPDGEINSWPKLWQEKVRYFKEYQYDPHLSNQTQKVFVQMYNQLPLYNATIGIFTEGQAIKGYKQTYFEVVYRGSGHKVIPAATALRNLVENGIIHRGEAIQSVELGFYGHTYDAEIQVLAPVWRVVHNSQIHYVNGITGMVEKLPEIEKNGTDVHK